MSLQNQKVRIQCCFGVSKWRCLSHRHLSEKIELMKASVSELESQLEQTQADASAAVEQWQEHATTLESEKQQLETDKGKLESEVAALKEASISEKV